MYLDREESAGETYKHKVEENGVTSYSPYDDAQRAQFKRIINNVIILDSDYAVEELGRGAARDYTVESVSKDTIVIKESVAGALENTRSLILDGKRIKAAFDYDADEGVLTVTINKIKVMSYNTGHYHYGVGSCIQEEYFDEKFNNWKNFYEETDCDIIGVQELLPWIDTARTLFSVEEFFDPVFVNGHSGKLDTGIFSKHIITEYSDGYLQDTEGSTRGYTKCYIDVNGVRVCVFCVHLSPASGAEDLRRQQIEYLLDAIKDEEYVIIFGDFNANNHEYDIFREYGYKLANGGEHGWKRTYNWQMNYTETANPALDRFIDNIIVSSNIIIESVEVLDYAYDYLTSDHLPIVAELIIN
jgi:endonuclease/exonuclease/phosphatase family metal-dependent hydrolase